MIAWRFWDMGQCTRACRVVHGSGYPDILGHSGSWAVANIEGSRQLWNTSVCSCQKVIDRQLKGGVISLKSVPRFHKLIETEQQWWFNTEAVCGVKNNTGKPQKKYYESLSAAKKEGANVLNCGQCGHCSTTHDTDRMHLNSKSLTKRASVAAVVYLLFGSWAHRLVTQSHILGIGYSQNCAWCWWQATECNLAHCARFCLFGWQNPLSSSNNVNTSKSAQPHLNACLHCDEVYCSAYYLQVCDTPLQISSSI